MTIFGRLEFSKLSYGLRYLAVTTCFLHLIHYILVKYDILKYSQYSFTALGVSRSLVLLQLVLTSH